MTFDVAIITANYGNYDSVKVPLAQSGVNVDWVLVTDNPSAPNAGKWRVVHEPRPDATSFRAAKRPKFRPWEYTDAPFSIWIDASVTIVIPNFASEVISQANPIACFSHDARDCAYTEARVSMLLKKYLDEPLNAQIKHYREKDHPDSWGLWLTTIVARQHTEAVKQMSVEWENECNAWSSQDQVSFPFVLRNAGVRPAGLLVPWSVCVTHSSRHVEANCQSVEYAINHK